jgi:hypothetical protein
MRYGGLAKDPSPEEALLTLNPPCYGTDKDDGIGEDFASGAAGAPVGGGDDDSMSAGTKRIGDIEFERKSSTQLTTTIEDESGKLSCDDIPIDVEEYAGLSSSSEQI